MTIKGFEDLDHPRVSFEINTDIEDVQRRAAQRAVLAHAKVIAEHVRNVRLKKGFEGNTDLPPKAENFTAALDEDADEPEAKAGLPESDAPERPYFIFWSAGHHNEFKGGEWVREPFLRDSMEATRGEGANAAAKAAESTFDFPGIRSPSKAAIGFGVFAVTTLFT